MNCGFVKTTDIKLWEENVRLDIHLEQFGQRWSFCAENYWLCRSRSSANR